LCQNGQIFEFVKKGDEVDQMRQIDQYNHGAQALPELTKGTAVTTKAFIRVAVGW